MSGNTGPQLLSLQHLLERDRARNTPVEYKAQRLQSSSGIGLLCRTMLRGSMTKWIIPTRLRDRETSELVFVGENCMHIKEIMPDSDENYQLRHLSTIPFDDDQIRSVALLGRSSRPRKAYNSTPNSASLFNSLTNPTPAHEQNEFPLQILLTALSSGFLQLATLDNSAKVDVIQFKKKMIPLPYAGTQARAHGKEIATDPFSRAFAVAAAFDSVVAYNNYNSAALKTRIASDVNDWNPIRQEKVFKLPGCITNIAFLNPGSANESLVVMVVVVSSSRHSSLWCLAWDHNEGPGQYRSVLESSPLQLEPDSLCDLIIPMAHSSDFLLVHGETVNLYRDILTTNPQVINISDRNSHLELGPIYPASSRRSPHFISWARADRDPTWRAEYIYLVREDGAIRHYHKARDQDAGIIGKAGTFGCHVNTAITSFSPTSYGTDYLVAAGDMSYGQLLSVGHNPSTSNEPVSREEAMRLILRANLPDWAPAMDINFVQSSTINSVPEVTITSGRQPFGALSQLRFGYEAKCLSFADLSDDDPMLMGANGMWACPDRSHGGVHFISSYSSATTAVWMRENGTFEASCLHVNHELSTVFAATTESGHVLVVDESGASLQILHDRDGGHQRSTLIPGGPILAADTIDSLLILAWRDGSISKLQCFLIGDEIKPISAPAGLENEAIALKTFSCGNEAYVLAVTHDGSLCLFLIHHPSQSNQFILLGKTKVLGSSSCDNSVSEIRSGIAQSIQILPFPNGDIELFQFHIICGMRDGRLSFHRLLIHRCHLDGTPDAEFMDQVPEPRKIGTGPVMLFLNSPASSNNLSDSSNRRISSAPQKLFAICDAETVVIELMAGIRGGDRFTLTNLYLTDDANSAFIHPQLCSIQTLALSSPHNYESLIACHDGQSLRIAKLTYERKMIPLRIPLTKYVGSPDSDLPSKDISGTPTKMIYSSVLNAGIVGGMRYELRPDDKVRGPSWQGKRVTRGFLSVIPFSVASTTSVDDESWSKSITHVDFLPTERILSLCEWRFNDGPKEHHFLLVGTSIDAHGGKILVEGKLKTKKRGRLWFFSPRKEPDGSIKLTLRNRKDIDCPVRGLAVLGVGRTRMVVCTDKQVDVYEISEQSSWRICCSVATLSPVVHVTTDYPYIYTSTLRHSVVAYEFKEASPHGLEEGPLFNIEAFFSDKLGRNTLTHSVLKVNSTLHQPSRNEVSQTRTSSQPITSRIILGSDKEGQIFGLDVPQKRRYENSADTLFELHVPQCVVKFAKGPVRKLWYEKGGTSGVLEDDVLGVTTDGTLYHFSIVSNEARLLLKYLENLVLWYETETGAGIDRLVLEDENENFNPIRREEREDEHGVVIDPEFVSGAYGRGGRKEAYGINGDLLLRLTTDDSVTILETMLNCEVDINPNGKPGRRRRRSSEQRRELYIGNERASRCAKFLELVDRALAGTKYEVETAGGDLERAIEMCVSWLHDVLGPVW